jgi:ABC-type ATPase with predicted acetyltransferase domain
MTRRPRHSPRVARTCAIFGLDPARRPGPPDCCDPVAARIDGALARGGIALLTGPSGAGKSATLRALAGRVRCTRVRPVRRGRRAVVDLFRCGLGRAMACLARAGLAEAGVMVRRASELSDGQRARLAIALAMSRARPGATILIDEFGSTLDRAAAASLARTLRRWARCAPVRVVCATAHGDLAPFLAPDVLVEFSLAAAPVVRIAADRRAAA